MARDPVDYYAVLQVNASATPQVIEAAYQTVLAQTPAGQAADPLVTEAYQVLNDPELRESYDRWYTGWFATHPDQVRAEARRRARRETERKVQASLGRLSERADRQLRSATEATGQSMRKAREATSRSRTAFHQRREVRRARARELPRLRRTLALHPVLAALVSLIVLAAVAAAVIISLNAQAERAEQARVEQAQAAADAEAARVAQEEADEAAAEAAQRQAQEDARAAADGVLAAQEAKRAAAAAAALEAQRNADEEARQECIEAVTGGSTDLAACDLSGTDLSELDLSGRDFTDASLSGADLQGAILDDAVLTGVRWAGATCPDGTEVQGSGSCGDFLLEKGDEGRPLALGDATQVGDWTVTVTSYQADAQSNARAVDWINNQPGQGFVYAIVGFEVTYDGGGQNQSPAGNLDFAINEIAYLDPDTHCSLPSDDGGWIDSLNTGQSSSYELCLYVPLETATAGVIGVYDGYSFLAEEPTAHWAIP